MIRIFSILAGLFFALGLIWSFGVDTVEFAKQGLPTGAERVFREEPKPLHLASDGVFGKFDKQQLQRGYAVYAGVCSNCHSLKQVAYRDLIGIGFTEGQVKAIAKAATISAPDPLTGEVKDRPGLPSDHFKPVVYAGKGHPPDLSLVTKAREGGAAYVYSLLTGYQAQQPAELLKRFPDSKTGEGLYYNPYFANLNIAMPPPLTADDMVTYAEGNPKATKDQMAKDVAAFLVWTAEPKLDKRKQTGWAVLGFLIFATVLGYFAKQQIWADKQAH